MNIKEQSIKMNAELDPGDTLKSRYRIIKQLGCGGFGRAYLAEDINRFNEHCVLKEFAPRLQETFALEKAQELFEREAGILYRLQHPQIPKFRELFRHQYEDGGRLFLVQDYVEGETYYCLCHQRLQQQGKFSEAEIERLLRQILPVLKYIHAIGVIHRDISPDNIILRSADELPMLIDFGSIKEAEYKVETQLKQNCDTTLSLIGTAIGKVGYAPPEQIERGVVFAHSDLYALAATAIVLLTGKKPQQLIEPDTYRWNWQQEVTISPKLEWVLSTMVSPYPSKRFASATEVINVLQNSSAIEIEEGIKKVKNESIGNKSQRFNSYEPISSQKRLLSGLFSKLLFFVPFSAVLILIGWLCFKVQNLIVATPSAVNGVNSTLESRTPKFLTRFSYGARVLIPQVTTSEKELGVTAFAEGNYQKAVSLFSASLKKVANDPETLIYLNNARIGTQKAYSIAVSIPIGSDVNAAQEILRGVAQAQTLVNQGGGVENIPLKVQIINDDNDPAIALEVAESLSQNKEILGVVGHYASDVTLATAESYRSGKLVAISPISTSVELSNLSPYLFRTVPSDRLAGRVLAQYMQEELQQQNVAIFYSSQSNYSKSLKSEFMTTVFLNGGKIAETFDLSDPNFNATNSFQQAVDNGAEVIMLAANTGTLDKALQVVQVNRQRLHLLGGDDVYTPKTLQIAGQLSENMVLAIPWHLKSNPDTEFAQLSRKLWGGAVNWRTAMAYDAARALIAAISRYPSREGVQKALSQPDFTADGASSEITFLPSGDRLKSIELVKVQSSKSNSGYEFEPLTNLTK